MFENSHSCQQLCYDPEEFVPLSGTLSWLDWGQDRTTAMIDNRVNKFHCFVGLLRFLLKCENQTVV